MPQAPLPDELVEFLVRRRLHDELHRGGTMARLQPRGQITGEMLLADKLEQCCLRINRGNHVLCYDLLATFSVAF